MKIIAMGGGGFSMETTPWMDRYILAAAEHQPPKVAFVATASGDNDHYTVRFHRALATEPCQTSDIALFERTGPLQERVAEQDVIYVGGGNTVNLLHIWRAHDLPEMLQEAYRSGTVLTGVSAGAMCWFEGGVTDSYGPLRPLYDGLGFLPGGFCPHYDEPGRRENFHRWAAQTGDHGYAADNGVALVFDDGVLADVIATGPDRFGYRVHQGDDGRTVEDVLPTRLISPPT